MSYFYEENRYLEKKIDSFFDQLRMVNDEQFDGVLSVLLLGSLSRNEATWCQPQDRPLLLSDIEFYTVYPVGFTSFVEFDRVISEASHKIFDSNVTSLFHVDNTWVSTEQLRRSQRKILTFDAQEMGVTVVGKNMKGLLPHIDISNINLEDIFDVLIHRIFSVLYYGANMPHDDNCFEYRYLLAKNSLDLTTVILASNGELVSGFVNKVNKLETLNMSSVDRQYFRYCLSIKLQQRPDIEFRIQEMETIFINTCIELSSHFDIPLMNRLVNLTAISRRRLGFIKRALKSRHRIVRRKRFLNNLIKTFQRRDSLSETDLLDNWVINGYPVPQH